MKSINAKGLDHKALNEEIRKAGGKCSVKGCCGQRFIAAGMTDLDLKLGGVPGNALGSYLNGGTIEVASNAQDAVGDTMNEGRIIIRGNVGDAAGGRADVRAFPRCGQRFPHAQICQGQQARYRPRRVC